MSQNQYHNLDLSNYTFLVTGAAGFIGSNIIEYLLSCKAGKVLGLDNFSTGSPSNIAEFYSNPDFLFIEGDITDYKTCLESTSNADIILHQAALGSVPRSIKDPITTNRTNIEGFLNILVAAKENKVKRVVYAASSSTYGDSPLLPKKEDIIGKPLSPYAVTKVVNEIYADVFSKIYGLETIGLRYFNVFGPKQNPEGAYAAVIPRFITAALNHLPITIEGDGEQTRDFTYIENVVQANIKAALTQNKNAVNQVYNIAIGGQTSIKDLFNKLKQLTNEDLNAEYKEKRQGDVRDSLADINKARNLLDYHPTIDFSEGLLKTFNWFKNQKSIEQ